MGSGCINSYYVADLRCGLMKELWVGSNGTKACHFIFLAFILLLCIMKRKIHAILIKHSCKRIEPFPQGIAVIIRLPFLVSR